MPRSLSLIAIILLALAVFMHSPAHAVRFTTSLGPGFDEPLAGMWERFGLCADEHVQRFGNEPAYFEWMALKLMWTDATEYKGEFVDKVRDFPMAADGYVWSWGDQHRWPTGDGSPHQENNAKYILSVYRIYSWTRDGGFLQSKDTTTTTNKAEPDYADVSEGMTVLEKCRAAMGYQLEDLHGADGLLLMDNGINTGKPDGHPTNYWDNFPFGYWDGYSNIYFYASLGAMAGLEEVAGEPEEASRLREIARECKEQYNAKFWNEFKGRYLGCIGGDGIVRDYGFVFLNLEAIYYGLADAEQARLIYQWLDGRRLIETDTSTGEDIYRFVIAPRATTRAIEGGGPPYWWFSLNGHILPDTNAAFGEHLENGGAIFYTSFYDVMGRRMHQGANAAFDRFSVIVDEFRKDGLLRDPVNNAGAPWKLGVIGEFPESGLVPAAFVYAFLGLDADHRGLILQPQLPARMDHATVDRLRYGDWDLKISTHGPQRTELECTSGPRGRATLQFRGYKPHASYAVTSEDFVRGQSGNLPALRTDGEGSGSVVVELRPGLKVSILGLD